MEIDLSFFLEPPEKSCQATLEIEPLAPLSMVTEQPGTYFRSEIHVPITMVYGALENLLGWHFPDEIRRRLMVNLKKLAKKLHRKNADYNESPWLIKKAETTGSGYMSLLQYHLDLMPMNFEGPLPMAYDDCWSMHLNGRGITFVGGSRHYERSLEELITKSKQKEITEKGKEALTPIQFGDGKNFQTYTIEELRNLETGEVKVTSLKPWFPQYYVSPKTRGYIVPSSSLRFEIRCTPTLSRLLTYAIRNPKAPIYLGSNDGWVEFKWKTYE